LPCTGRNQPMRISWAIPCASLRSVFIDIAEKRRLNVSRLQKNRFKPSPAQAGRATETTDPLRARSA
jgi:hypothetical protein